MQVQTNTRYQSIIRLHELLEQKQIPHEFVELYDGYQIIYPSKGNCVMDAIEHSYSYGCEYDLLEIMGLLTAEEREHDSVKGYLSYGEVLDRIENHWNSQKK